jgi:uncharacterized lipoprotein NlpE involved in copper resistance
MSKIIWKTIIKSSIILVLLIILGCNNNRESYTDITVKEFNNLTTPIILFSKTKDVGLYSVVLKYGNDSIHFMGNNSLLARSIGENYEVGDTLKK